MLNWIKVKSLANLDILNRASVFFLLSTPILASIWPSLVSLVNRVSGTQEFVPAGFPDSWAALFFASLFVFAGRTVFEIFCPNSIKTMNIEQYVESAVDGYLKDKSKITLDNAKKHISFSCPIMFYQFVDNIEHKERIGRGLSGKEYSSLFEDDMGPNSPSDDPIIKIIEQTSRNLDDDTAIIRFSREIEYLTAALSHWEELVYSRSYISYNLNLMAERSPEGRFFEGRFGKIAHSILIKIVMTLKFKILSIFGLLLSSFLYILAIVIISLVVYRQAFDVASVATWDFVEYFPDPYF